MPPGSQFSTEIQWLADQGISTGWAQPDGTRIYQPLQPVARDAMAAFMYRLAGSPAFTTPAVSPFADVPSTSQFYKEITWLAAQGISTGWTQPDGTRIYQPLLPVARDAMAAFMYRLAGSPAFTAPASSPFADITTATQFYKEITWLAANGISTGWTQPDGTKAYQPLSPVARDAMAAFMYRYYLLTHPQAPPVGNDVSWPQCGSALPSGQAFAIVGVNNGLASTTNPCLAEELSWATTSTGGTSQPPAALYVNTANPGAAGSWWPQSNTYAGTTVANPYGQCAPASEQAACAYIYGWAKAYDDATIRGVPNPASYTWWLDVETGNIWSAATAANTADLEGMTAYFTSIGAKTGIYSSSTQLTQITGTVPPRAAFTRSAAGSPEPRRRPQQQSTAPPPRSPAAAASPSPSTPPAPTTTTTPAPRPADRRACPPAFQSAEVGSRQDLHPWARRKSRATTSCTVIRVGLRHRTPRHPGAVRLVPPGPSRDADGAQHTGLLRVDS